jgi:hypothetical protein
MDDGPIVSRRRRERAEQEGVLIKAKAGDVYSEPIAKFHRGHNPHPALPYLCIGICLTAPDRDHVTNAVTRPW